MHEGKYAYLRRAAFAALAAFATTLVVLAFAAVSALAAAPEAPKTEPAKEVTSTSAVFHGLLNPHAAGKGVGEEWLFFWAPGTVTCQEYGIAPEVVGLAGTKEGEEEETPFPGLEENTLNPNSQYTYCLAARSEPEEAWTYGNPQTFKTLPSPPIIVKESTSGVTATTATLEAEINPGNELTSCRIEYGAATVTENEAACEPSSFTGGPQTVHLPVTGLESKTTYQFRVVAENAQSRKEGKPAIGAVATFTTTTPFSEPPEAEPANPITATEATLHGVLNPHSKRSSEPGSAEFVYQQSLTECRGGNEKQAGDEKTPTGAEAEAAEAKVTGLLPGATYTACLLARSESGETALSPPMTFTTLAVGATVESESVSFTKAGSSSVELHAKIDPGGAPTSYFFEYGTTETYSSVTPAESAGAGSEPVGVSATLEGLRPETKYYFRVVASNTQGPASGGKGDSFSTFPASLLGLPDGRAYELVSPLNDGDATVLTGNPARAAVDGNAVAYIGTAPPTGGNGEIIIQGGRPKGVNVYLARRSVGGGWTAADIQPDGLNTAVYRSFSSDLSLGVLGSEQALIDGAPNERGQDGLYTRDDSDGSYELLGVNAIYGGSTPDGSHVLFSTARGLYDSVGGRLENVSVLPDGGAATEATFGATNSEGLEELEGVISSDGSRIFWTDTSTEVTSEDPAGVTRLFVREDDTSPEAATVQVDASEVPEGNGPTEAKERLENSGGGTYMTASANGDKVFFTDEKNLTLDATAAPGKPDLYEFLLPWAEHLDGELKDLSVDTNIGPHGEHEHASVAGILGASENGSYIYFAAAGALANGASSQECHRPSEGEPAGNRCNVYVVHEAEPPKLVATVAAFDGEGGERLSVVVKYEGREQYFGDWTPKIGFRSARVTPDGQQLIFESIENLTEFNAGGGREIYMYNYGNSGVSCVSCNPSGTPTEHGGFFEFAHAELPASFSSTYALRDVSVNGDRVFFESNEELVSQETNEEATVPLGGTKGLTNVYEWEREGSDESGTESCPVRVPASPSGGCIFLLSDGTSPDISFFIDASENGRDVFIGTRAQLVPQDHGETYEVYDAHECTSIEPCTKVTEPECSGTGCQGIPAAPPIFSTPSSATITGTDDLEPAKPTTVVKQTAAQLKAEKLSKALKACHADKRAKKRMACEAAARHKYGSSKKAVKKK
jgi:hypothetical protein